MNNNPTNVILGGKEYDTFTEPPAQMELERAKTQFKVRDVTNFLTGSEQETLLTERIMREIERDPVLNVAGDYDADLPTKRRQAVERIGALARYLPKDSEKEAILRGQLHGIVDMGTRTRIAVHYGLFMGAIRGSGTKEQYDYWVAKGAATLHKFYGCFAMTELGHGSNVAGLETTATLDKDTDEFIINTPNSGATKWWIGGAAHSATHTACLARLIVDGKDYGVKIFIVQLRDLNSHSLLNGIAIGDIGKKMGRDAIDNGWIQFTDVRIPRQNMLMRYDRVSRDGEVTTSELAQLTYGALLSGRVTMIAESHLLSARFLTIALRYACIRRQFGAVPDKPETKLIDYPYHQRRLLPLLAYTYAMKMGADEAQQQYNSSFGALLKLNPVKDAEKFAVATADLKALFASSAGMKAFTTWAAAKIIDECRQACGGHGYSGYNGFGQAYADWVVQCTWEGDNNVLCLSMGRSLIQSCIAMRKKKGHVGKSVEYLQRRDELQNARVDNKPLTDPAVLITAWEKVACEAINRATDSFIKLTQEGLSPDQAFEELSQQRFECARIHTRKHLITSFYARISKAKARVKPHLTVLANLFAVWSIEEDSGLFLREGCFEPAEMDEITALVDELCCEAREQVIGFTDAFNLSDFFINAPIGRFDGDAYKHYMDEVKAANNPRNTHAPYYETKLRPFLFRPDEDEEICDLDE
ncbi:acyl-CoA oxidase 5 [Yarrowia lipolytica]|jgi:acyl-CoA oxidase|uniref:Acyl-coenzyme A oxidase n=2 Tax=Yarrowia lipolytica TaxID=4952 RepID=F2Z630_YARLI|nr:YALI0C23859p [Yarrowia lipolytica CLIB122]AOW03329.1 hypothetical protein YALI1_C32886g [Yarrowia lipolytica]KAB8280260.1 acyl-CoA oxidase 5 [Yarrowia lipolytica]KAE8169351.1 acyl-CoA oxidase 5 [Yarrowia lipolytica]KAJ8053810.1 acyl-CoA oxidase 5 [Yarrowia lipolytica]QNP96040.1 Acyl-coenzyme A oxidase 3 [Yarrowia lipolytica]|eukprot:XP_502199.1 YALI0C23859p [Yarrowia lipolytica CLIB122]